VFEFEWGARANNGLFHIFRHGHVPPSFRVPVRRGRRGRLRDHRLRDPALGLVVLCMPCADDRPIHGSCPNVSMMSSQLRRPLFPVDDGVG